jgi:Superfamily II helicase
MRPEKKSELLLGVTRSKAKMFEYGVPEEHHIKILQDPAKLFTISIGLLGDVASEINDAGDQVEKLTDLKKNLLFSARFFDAYLQSRQNATLDPYLILLASASYYLCDLPGSASILANTIGEECPDLDGEGLEDLLLWLLQADLSTYFIELGAPFGEYIEGISKRLCDFYDDGAGEEIVLDFALRLRKAVYDHGTPRQLLLGDIIAAVVKRKLQNSSWNALPLYSGLPRERWLEALRKSTFIKELWPAQHLMGQAEVLRGKSSIIQMPTSAGKTKATELILRSAFLSDRTSLAIIVAPFRALCHEIKDNLVEAFSGEPIRVDELSDALQTDFVIAQLLGHQQILVVTPEKLLYVLRHSPELASYARLLLFDEGHQFDSGTRGITYELLLTSLNSMLPEDTQKVLISAVISNARTVGEWLNGVPNVVEGINLTPTSRSIGFASWLDQLGRIEYVDINNIEATEFFVPRVIESYRLTKNPREKKERYFPDQADGHSVALYLGIKLIPRGSVAVFCGRKATAATICQKAAENIDRGIPLELPRAFSNQTEVDLLHHLHVANLGTKAPASRSAEHGIFSHHGNTPHGIRLAVEHAMREDLVKFVVCTSTLAQGVNLPIRYLIVTSVYQGKERIKVRDFHNLIGRAGRAGMHTEGSILFADPVVYDKRRHWKEKWRWNQVKELLDPSNSEPCISNLLSIFDPIFSDDKKWVVEIDALSFAQDYISDPEKTHQHAELLIRRNIDKGFSRENVERQVLWKISLISAIENFLLAHWDEKEEAVSESDVVGLAEKTLAYFLADEKKKEGIRRLFKVLAANISSTISEPSRRKVYGKTLYGIRDAQAIEAWVLSYAQKLCEAKDNSVRLDIIWPLLIKHVQHKLFKKFDKPEVLKELAQMWLAGVPFHKILEHIHTRNARMIWGEKRRVFIVDHVVDVCEGGLAYDATLLISAIVEFIHLAEIENASKLVKQLSKLQKQLKYGLPDEPNILLYELGISDRVIVLDLVSNLELTETRRTLMVNALKAKKDAAINIINKYPSYFQERLNYILT